MRERERGPHINTVVMRNATALYFPLYKFTGKLAVFTTWQTGQMSINPSQSAHRHKCLQGNNKIETCFFLQDLHFSRWFRKSRFPGLLVMPGCFKEDSASSTSLSPNPSCPWAVPCARSCWILFFRVLATDSLYFAL